MILSYNIINKNLEKLDDAINAFPKILGVYQKSTDSNERLKLRSLAEKIGLSDYIAFIDALGEKPWRNKVIVDDISFDELKTKMIESCIDLKVKEFMKKKTKKGLHSFLNSNTLSVYGGYSGYGSARRKRYYSSNFSKSYILILNYVIQNGIEIYDVYGGLARYFTREISNFEVETQTELDVTKDIAKSLSRKISSIKYDFRKLNFNLLRNEIESKIKDRMLNVDKGEKIKCIEAKNGLTLNNVYDVISYEISMSGNLIVIVRDDNNINTRYNYRIFESISKLRDNNIDDILKLIEK